MVQDRNFFRWVHLSISWSAMITKKYNIPSFGSLPLLLCSSIHHSIKQRVNHHYTARSNYSFFLLITARWIFVFCKKNEKEKKIYCMRNFVEFAARHDYDKQPCKSNLNHEFLEPNTLTNFNYTWHGSICTWLPLETFKLFKKSWIIIYRKVSMYHRVYVLEVCLRANPFYAEEFRAPFHKCCWYMCFISHGWSSLAIPSGCNVGQSPPVGECRHQQRRFVWVRV